MASPLAAPRSRLVWVVANPWLWMLLALLLIGQAFLWSRFFDEAFTAVRVILVALGVLAAGGAVALRLQQPGPAFAEQVPANWRREFLIILGVIHAALVSAVIWLFCASCLNLDVPWSFDTVLIINVLVVPVAGTIAYLCFTTKSRGQEFSREQEVAALLVLAAVRAVLGGWALYLDGDRADDWDTMRTFLGGLALFALVGAPLALLPTALRRLGVSVLILLHLGGIVMAALRPAPEPWLVEQVWMRVYRPYLQFMWLINAYQFYAPDPGPSHFLWFRLEYQRPDGTVYTRWEKFPRQVVTGDPTNPTTESGAPDYFTGIQFQRRVGMTDQAFATDNNFPREYVTNSNNKLIENPIFYYRKLLADPAAVLGAPLDEVRFTQEDRIPFHPAVTLQRQYHPPSFGARKLLESCARHLATEPDPDHPEARFVAVRIYCVEHNWPDPGTVARGITDLPVNYHPFYMGRYDAQGNVLDAPVYNPDGSLRSGDPLLYWLLPITTENTAVDVTQQPIYGYVYRHAGDRRWVMYPGTRFWQEERPDKKK